MPRLLIGGLIAALCSPVVWPQTRVDAAAAGAVLAASSSTREGPEFPCQVSAVKPFLNIGLRLQTGYIARVPAVAARSLNVLLAVTAVSGGQPAYLTDHVALPKSETAATYETAGAFFVGPGRYFVKWLLFDDAGHSCTKSWQIEAAPPAKAKLAAQRGTVTDVALTTEARPEKQSARRVTILLDVAPVGRPAVNDRVGGARFFQRAGRGGVEVPPVFGPGPVESNALGSGDQVLLLGALSALLEQLPASQVRLAAFSLAYQRELYRNDAFRPGAFSEVAHAIAALEDSGVDYRVLLNRTGHIDLLAALIDREMRANPPSDIVVFLGPRERFHDAFPAGKLDTPRGPAPQFFFLRYEMPQPAHYLGANSAAIGGDDISDRIQDIARSGGLVMSAPPGGMRDTVTRAVQTLHGKSLPFSTPGQFAKAVSEIDRRSRAK